MRRRNGPWGPPIAVPYAKWFYGGFEAWIEVAARASRWGVAAVVGSASTNVPAQRAVE